MSAPNNEPLARFTAPIPPDEVMRSLRSLSKKGKLAGYRVDPDDPGSGAERRAIADAQGTPFDADLRIASSATEQGSEITITTRLRRKLPLLFAFILLLTIYPGLPLSDAFLRAFTWYENLMGDSIKTWMWYLPLTVIPAPFAVRTSIKRSIASSREHAIETTERLRAVLGAS